MCVIRVGFDILRGVPIEMRSVVKHFEGNKQSPQRAFSFYNPTILHPLLWVGVFSCVIRAGFDEHFNEMRVPARDPGNTD